MGLQYNVTARCAVRTSAASSCAAVARFTREEIQRHERHPLSVPFASLPLSGRARCRTSCRPRHPPSHLVRGVATSADCCCLQRQRILRCLARAVHAGRAANKRRILTFSSSVRLIPSASVRARARPTRRALSTCTVRTRGRLLSMAADGRST